MAISAVMQSEQGMIEDHVDSLPMASTGLTMNSDDECNGEGRNGSHCALSVLHMRAKQSTARKPIENKTSGLLCAASERQARLQKYGTTTLFHQTTPEWGRKILQTGFNVNYGGTYPYNIAGKATYFATTLWATNFKTHHFGFCIEAQVYCGVPKLEPKHPEPGLALKSLNTQCYDSVHIDRGYAGGDEYVVYANDQMPKSLYKEVPCPKCYGTPWQGLVKVPYVELWCPMQ